ncbi:MAG: HesB/IscA family protein [Bacteroidia bacterium]|jgi:iron-sulfur cluster assembly protein
METMNTNHTTETLITLSPTALAELKRLTAQFQHDHMIRIGVKGGGCSGLTYILDQGKADESQDYILHFEGLQVAVNKAQALYLQGVLLDFGSGLDNRGFVFENPNASSTCGCGTSFAI